MAKNIPSDRWRARARRREEIAADARASIAAFRAGKLKASYIAPVITPSALV